MRCPFSYQKKENKGADKVRSDPFLCDGPGSHPVWLVHVYIHVGEVRFYAIILISKDEIPNLQIYYRARNPSIFPLQP